MIEENKSLGEYKQFLKSRDTGLLINKNDKDILSYGAKKFRLNIYKRIGWLEYDEVGDFHDGFFTIEKDSKYNFMDKDGKLLFNERFDLATDFHEGFAIIGKNHKYNFLTTKGELLMKSWLPNIPNNFQEGLALIRYEDYFNYINTKGESYFINPFNYKRMGDFSEGYAYVEISIGEYNLIDKKGNLLFDKNITYEPDQEQCMSDGLIIIRDEEENVNFLNKDGKLLKNKRFDRDIGTFSEGFCSVGIKGKGWNFINTKGEYLSKTRFDLGYPFSNGLALVYNEHCRMNFLKRDGSFLLKDWILADVLDEFYDGCAKIIYEIALWDFEGINFLTKTGEYLFKENLKQYDSIKKFSEGYAAVEKNGKRNFIDKKGNLLF